MGSYSFSDFSSLTSRYSILSIPNEFNFFFISINKFFCLYNFFRVILFKIIFILEALIFCSLSSCLFLEDKAKPFLSLTVLIEKILISKFKSLTSFFIMTNLFLRNRRSLDRLKKIILILLLLRQKSVLFFFFHTKYCYIFLNL